jgi:hypothetical protein
MSLETKENKNNYLIATGKNQNVYLNTKEDENGEELIKCSEVMPYFDMKPHHKGGIRMLLSGGTGSGKSYMCKQIIKQIKCKRVYLFSSLNDGDYDDVKHLEQIDLINILSSNPNYTVHDIFNMMETNCCCIFDDVMSFGNKLSKIYLELRAICMQKGRHKGMSIFVCEQQAQMANKSRDVLLNCQYFCCFPRNNFKAFNSLASNYLGLTKDKIEYLRKLKSRYVMFNKNYPAYYVSSVEVGML